MSPILIPFLLRIYFLTLSSTLVPTLISVSYPFSDAVTCADEDDDMPLAEGVDEKDRNEGRAVKEVVEGIKIGHSYEIDRSFLPQGCPADLRAARVVMVHFPTSFKERKSMNIYVQ